MVKLCVVSIRSFFIQIRFVVVVNFDRTLSIEQTKILKHQFAIAICQFKCTMKTCTNPEKKSSKHYLFMCLTFMKRCSIFSHFPITTHIQKQFDFILNVVSNTFMIIIIIIEFLIVYTMSKCLVCFSRPSFHHRLIMQRVYD